MKSIEEIIVAKYFDKFDKKITEWMGKYGLLILRVCLGIIFLWFGVLKFFKGLSPAEELVRKTIYFMDPDIFTHTCALGIYHRTWFNNRKIYAVNSIAFISSDARNCIAVDYFA